MIDPAEVHASALIIDTHADTPQRFLDESWNFTDPIGRGHISLAAARAGNLAAEFFAIWAEPPQWRGRFRERTLALIEAVLAQVRRAPDHLRLCTKPDDILAAHRDRQFAVLFGIEGGHSIENSLENLRLYHDLGARYMTLTWSNSNEWADSSGDLADPAIPHHNGLTPFGHDVVREMNRLGMIVDVSHASDKTLTDVITTTRAPILATHSSARALTAAPRNLTDEQIGAIAATGGAIMVNLFPAFIDEAWRSAWNAQRPERHAAQQALAATFAAQNQPVPFHATDAIDRDFAARIPPAPLSAYIDHIDHIARTAGIDHVGIGTDFDGIPATPVGLDSAADLIHITAALLDRGYTRAGLHKLLGGNLLRVFREVQAAAAADTSLPVRIAPGREA
jgi:membrane dipeptidase